MNVSNQDEDDCCPFFIDGNGKKLHPMNLDGYLMAVKVISSLFGIPLNVFIAINIIRICRSHYKPRYIFLLGIIFSDLSAFVLVAIELIYWNMPNESVCQVYVVLRGIPYTLLLLSMLFALCDRYVAIRYPMWHRENLSSRLVISCHVSCSVFLAFLIKFVYIFQLVPLRCDVRLLYSQIGVSIVFSLFISCIIFNFVVYRQTKAVLAQSKNSGNLTRDPVPVEWSLEQRTAAEDEPTDGRQVRAAIDIIMTEFIELPVVNNDVQNTTASAVVIATNYTAISQHSSCGLSTHVDSLALSRLELESARTLIAGVVSLTVMACPVLIFALVIHVCRIAGNIECWGIYWVGPYFVELFLVHAAIYNPLIWLIRNNEFRLVFRN